MSEQLLREIRDEIRGLRSDLRANTAELRKLVRNASGDGPGCPKCGGELEDTSTMAGERQTCSVCHATFNLEVTVG